MAGMDEGTPQARPWGSPRPDLGAWAGVLAVAACLAALVLATALGTMWDNDVYFIIATGRDILANGIATTEPLTLHDGLDYMAQQWLVCVVDAWLYDNAGPLAVIGFHAAVWVAAFAALYRCAVVLSGGRVVVARALLAIAALCSFVYIRTNPRGVDVLAFALSLLAAERFFALAASDRSRAAVEYLAAQLVLAIGMVNLHAALWPVLLFVPCANLFRKRTSAKDKAAALLATVAAIALAAFAVNPYDGAMTLRYVLTSLTASSFDALDILEMQPANIGVKETWCLFVGIGAYIACAASMDRKSFSAPCVLLFCGTAILALCAIRQTPLFVAAALFAFADVSRTAKWEAAGAVGNRFLPAVAGMLMLVCAVGLPVGVLVGNASVEDDARKPAVDALYESGLEPGSEVFAGFNTGAYCEFRGLRPYMDARAEVFVPEVNGGHDIAGEYVSLVESRLRFDDLCERYDFDAVLREADSDLQKEEIEDAGYRIVYDEDGLVAGIAND